jgi:predicted ATP-grasp superfamily ATP-dependent carboligase
LPAIARKKWKGPMKITDKKIAELEVISANLMEVAESLKEQVAGMRRQFNQQETERSCQHLFKEKKK